jgi:hypothetical protein
MRAEFEKQSKSSPLAGASRSALGSAAGGGATSGGGFDLAGWMAGTSPGPAAALDSVARDVATRGSATGRENGGSGRRRG